MALKALPTPVRQEVGDLDLIVSSAARTSKGTLVSLFAQRGRDPVHSSELLITVPEERARVAGQLANGEAPKAEQALLLLSFAVENALRELEAKKPETREKDELQGRQLTLKDPEPWPHPVDGGALLAELREIFDRYLVLPIGATVVLALWTLHTYLADSFDHVAYLAITSPTKRSGKTTTIQVVRTLARRSVSGESVSPATLYRVIEQAKPTIFLDEVDREPADSEVWGVLNSGHTRGGAVLRLVGDDHEPRAFGTFCPKLLAYIRPARSPVPDTVEDRSVRITIQRRRRTEQRERLRSRVLEAEAEPLRRQLARWAEDHADLGEARPAIPDELDDRAADCWEPLLASADAIGGDWPTSARAVAIRLSADRAEEEGDSPGVLLLLDLGALLDSGELKADELGIAGDTCTRLLRELPDRPWRTWGRKGEGITDTALARLLKPFEVRPEKVGPRQYRRMRYAEATLRAAVERFSTGVRVGDSAPTLTPCRKLESAPVSDSAATVSGCQGLTLTEEGTNPDAGAQAPEARDPSECPICSSDSCAGDLHRSTDDGDRKGEAPGPEPSGGDL